MYLYVCYSGKKKETEVEEGNRGGDDQLIYISLCVSSISQVWSQEVACLSFGLWQHSICKYLVDE